MEHESSKSPDLVESFSGIRGIYGNGITESLAKRYVFCYCEMFSKKLKSVVVGGDSRPSTPTLKKAIIEAFQEYGIEKIIDAGCLPIQACEYSVIKFKADGGFYVSASHNEPQYNGWKILKNDGALLYQDQSKQLIEMVYSRECSDNNIKIASILENREDEAIKAYCDYVIKKIGEDGWTKIKQSSLKLLVDPNGGASINVWKRIINETKINAELINSKLGEFNRLVEPNAKSLAYLDEKIRNGGFAFAAGFDADADRMEFAIASDTAFANEMGPVVNGNYVLALTFEAILSGTSGQTAVTNDVTAYLVRDIAKKYKAKIYEVEVGEMPAVEEMERRKSIVGGEGSNGGVIIPPIKCRDGILTTLLVLKFLAQKGRTMADVLGEYPKYYSDRVVIKCSPEKAIEIRKKLEQYFKEQGHEVKKTGDETGGLKIDFDDNSYVWFRQSKTEPGSFRVISDTDSKEKTKKLLEIGISAFEKFK